MGGGGKPEVADEGGGKPEGGGACLISEKGLVFMSDIVTCGLVCVDRIGVVEGVDSCEYR